MPYTPFNQPSCESLAGLDYSIPKIVPFPISKRATHYPLYLYHIQLATLRFKLETEIDRICEYHSRLLDAKYNLPPSEPKQGWYGTSFLNGFGGFGIDFGYLDT